MQQSKQNIESILNLIHSHQDEMALQCLLHLNVADQAQLILILDESLQLIWLKKLPQVAEALEYMPLQHRLKLSIQLSDLELADVLNQMHSDDFMDVYQNLSQTRQQQIYALLSKTTQHELEILENYVGESAGALMSANFVTFPPDLTMNQAIEQLRQVADNQDTLYLMYIVSESQKLLGVISLRQIIQAPPEARIVEIMTKDVIFASVNEDQETVAKMLAYYDFIALPIVDEQSRLVGIVTYDDAMDITERENTEDILKSSAMSPLQQHSLKTAPILSLYKKRVFWLVILVFGSLLSGIGIAYFEDIIATHIVLVFFLPLLVGSGGNAGSQSATLMVRAIATGDVELKDWFKLLGRETMVALCLGATMAFAVSILGYIRGDFSVAVVLAISMMGIVMLGCLIGMSLPFILNKLKMDPASASAPLVTSICDATGVVVYLFVASKILF